MNILSDVSRLDGTETMIAAESSKAIYNIKISTSLLQIEQLPSEAVTIPTKSIKPKSAMLACPSILSESDISVTTKQPSNVETLHSQHTDHVVSGDNKQPCPHEINDIDKKCLGVSHDVSMIALPLIFLDAIQINLGGRFRLPTRRELVTQQFWSYNIPNKSAKFHDRKLFVNPQDKFSVGKYLGGSCILRTNGVKLYQSLYAENQLGRPAIKGETVHPKNQFTAEEKNEIQSSYGDEFSWKVQVSLFVGAYQDYLKSTVEILANKFSPQHKAVGNNDKNSKYFYNYIEWRHFKIFRIEFYVEYSTSPDNLKTIRENLERGIGGIFGHIKTTTQENSKERRLYGHLVTYEFSIKDPVAPKRIWGQVGLLKLYEKHGTLRLELAYVKPFIREFKPIQFDLVSAEIQKLAVLSQEKFKLIHEILAQPATECTFNEVMDALRVYNIKPNNSVTWRYLAEAISKNGFFDTLKARGDGIILNVKMVKRICDADTGIFIKENKHGLHSKTNTKLYKLRKDWKEMLEKIIFLDITFRK